MSKINPHIIVYDFETGDKDPSVTEPIEIAAIVLDRDTLEEIGSFESMCRPEDLSIIVPRALEVNKKTMEQVEAAPPLKKVWTEFVEFCVSHKQGHQKWGFPIQAGHNILNFDSIITDRMNARYGVERFTNDHRYRMFHPQYIIDTFQSTFFWYEGTEAHLRPESFSLDNIRNFAGMRTDDAHSAFPDVRDTAKWMKAFLKMNRNLSQKIKFQGVFSEQ